ncbi:hypothetical protein ACFXHD_11435 [Streptomyces hydrogenans]
MMSDGTEFTAESLAARHDDISPATALEALADLEAYGYLAEVAR